MPDERMKTLIEDFVKKIDNINTWPLYSQGAIPKRKLKHALAYIAQGVNEDDILFYVDFTVWGSGKDGLVFTSDKLLWRDTFSDPKEGLIECAKIKSVSTKGDDLVINSSKIVPIRLGKKEEKLIHELLSHIAKENRAGEKTKGTREKKKEQIKEKIAEERLKVAQPAEEPERKLDKKTLAELSKLMTYILRHDRKNESHVDFDEHCYAEINQVVEAIASKSEWVWITREHIEAVADQSVYRGKKRFEIKGDKIRATYNISRRCPSTLVTTPKPRSPLPFLENEWYVIIAKRSGKCLDVSSKSIDKGANIIQYDYWGGDNQQWKLEPVKDGYSRIIARHSNKCLDVGGMGKESGANIIQYDYWGGDNQQWKLEPVKDGYFRIIAKHSGKCLDAGGRRKDKKATYIRQWNCAGRDNQLWKLELASELDLRTARVWSVKGYTLANSGKYDDAIICFDKALEINPKYTRVWRNKGYALNNLKRYVEAITCLDEALEINPNSAHAWSQKGYALFNLNKFEEALECFDKALEIAPRFEEAINSKKIAKERLSEKEKPKITIQLSETAFTPNAWRRIELTLKNTGTAPATEIQLEYPHEKVEIDGLSAIATLNPNDEKSLQIGLRPLHVGEVPLTTRIRYKDLDNNEYKDEKTFWITVEAGVGTEVEGGVEEQKPIIKRETEFFNGFVRMKMAVTNPMSQIITDVSLDLDFDEKTLRLDRHEPEYPVKRGKVQLGTISPGTGKTVAFHLDPMTCTKAGTELNCRVDYKDAYGKPESTRMAPKKVEVVCPIFSTESDINIGMLKEFIKNLPCQDSKVFHIPAGLDKDRLVELCRETIQMHDVRHIRTLRTKDDKTCETWYYGKTKVEKSTIVINGRISEATGSIEIFAATPSPESLTGLLAELGHNLTKKITEVGKKPEQIVNVSIRDNVIQRSPNLLNLCDTNGVCSEENVIVEDNVIKKS
jgi:tetratricopeptide (TPR) repeat protein